MRQIGHESEPDYYRGAEPEYRQPTVRRNGGDGKKPPMPAKNRPAPSQKKWIRGLLIAFVVLLVGAAGVGVWAYITYKNPESAFSAPKKTVTVSGQSVTPVSDDTIANVLILGIDSNAKRVAKQKGYRSDVIMLAQVNFSDKKIVLLSIPRDTWVTFNVLNMDDGSVKSTTENRINAAYGGLGGGGPNHYGAENSMACVSDFLACDGKYSIPIDIYMSIDLDGIPKLVEELGGVEVTLDRDLAGVGKKGETVKLNGTTADTYLRKRKDGGGNDEGRVARQQEFIKAAIKRIKDMGAVSAAPSLLNSFNEFGRTNLNLQQALSLAGFASDFSLSDITRYQVSAPKQGQHYIADKAAMAEFIEANMVYGVISE